MATAPTTPPRSTFTSLYYSGPQWRPATEFPEQAGFRAQVAWWREQEAAGVMGVIGQPVGPRNPELPIAVLAVTWEATDLDAAEALAAAAPLVQSGVLLVSTVAGAPKP